MYNRECQSNTRLYSYALFLIAISLLFAACGSPAKYLAKGEEYLAKRKFHEAMMQFRAASEADTNSAQAHWGLARAYENLGQFNDVVDELRKTVELDENNLEAKARLGNYFLLVQPPMIAEAAQIRDNILAADAKFIEGHILGATIMAAQKKPDDEVIKAVNKAIELDPQRIQSYISLQRLYMTREKTAEAEAAIRRGLVANPRAVEGYTEYGRFLMYGSRDKEAEAQFLRGISVDSANIEIREALAEFYITSKQIQKAESTYQDLVQMQENSPESRLELAEFYARTSREDEAISVLNSILSDAPEYALARYRLAEVYLDRKDSAKVSEQLDALLKVNDHDTEALTIRAKLGIQDSNPEAAVKDLEEILKKLPSSREPLFLMAQARLTMGQLDQGRAFIADLERYHPTYLRTGLLKIQAAVTSGDPQTAIKLATELVGKANATTSNADVGPQFIEEVRARAITARGLAYLDLGRVGEAKADLERVLTTSPNSPGAMVNLAKAHAAGQEPQRALDLYEKALRVDTQSFDAMTGIVSSLIQMQQAGKAHARIASLMGSNAEHNDVIAALHYLNSTVFAAEEDIRNQESELVAAIRADADYLPSYASYATLLAGQGRVDDAIAQYRFVIEKRPAAQAWTMMGILEDSRGHTVDAEKAYRSALEIAPETPIAANNLACLIVSNQGNLDEALQLATMAVAKSPTVAGFYDTLGWVYLQKGHTLPAVEQLKKAVALSETAQKKNGVPADPAFRVRLGIALAKSGDKIAARREVESSLKFASNLSARDVADARTVLATL